MYKYLNHIYNPLYTLFLLPVSLCSLLLLSDYLIIPKTTVTTYLAQANIYTPLRGKGKPCRASINVVSKWGNEVYETKSVSDVICKSDYKDISITHTTILRRWLVLTSNEKNHYFVDHSIFIDIMFLVTSVFTIFGILNGKLKKYYKYPYIILYALPIISLNYLYTYIFSQWF